MSVSTSSVIYPRRGERPQIVHSTYGYASGYKKPKSIPEQVDILWRQFPFLTRELLDVSTTERPAHDFAEGWFVVPHWGLFAQTYSEAFLIALEQLKKVRGGKVYQYCSGRMGIHNLCRNLGTEGALRGLSGGDEKWWSNIAIIPAQFGIRYRGVSPYYAKRTFRERELGLGLFEGIIMLITHPERLNSDDDLWIEFPGDSYYPCPEGMPIHTPFMNIVDGEIGVGTSLTNEPGAHYGSATWFLP